MKPFTDRQQAGELLARRLGSYAGAENAVLLALPRGGVPVGYAIAKALGIPLDMFLVRKLGLPGNEEYAIGAIASGGARVLRTETITELKLTPATIEAIAQRERGELERREALYRGSRPALPLRERLVILVDDGVATGATIKVAAQAVRAVRPLRLIIAIPVAPVETWQELQSEADEVVCLHTPVPFYSVGQWYEEFGQTSDREVIALLEQARRDQESRTGALPSPLGKNQGGAF
jgi:putative phosphoribosyl transferase